MQETCIHYDLNRKQNLPNWKQMQTASKKNASINQWVKFVCDIDSDE